MNMKWGALGRELSSVCKPYNARECVFPLPSSLLTSNAYEVSQFQKTVYLTGSLARSQLTGRYFHLRRSSRVRPPPFPASSHWRLWLPLSSRSLCRPTLPSKHQVAYLSPRLGIPNNIPFVIPFELRVSIFRSFVATTLWPAAEWIDIVVGEALLEFPAEVLVDYVRAYQRKGQRIAGAALPTTSPRTISLSIWVLTRVCRFTLVRC